MDACLTRRRTFLRRALGVAIASVLGVSVLTQAVALPGHAAASSACSPVTAPASTDLVPGAWTFGESRSGGHHAWVDGGLRVWTDGADLSQAKSAGYLAVDLPLADAADAALDVTQASGAAPGLQLTLYVDGVWKGNLVHEPLFADWWINKPIAGLPAGPNPSYQLAYGSIDQILAAYAAAGTSDVRVGAIGYSLGSGAIGDAVIHSITAGCTTHPFTLTPAAPTAPTASPSPSSSASPSPSSSASPSPSSSPSASPTPSAADLTPATQGLVTITGDLAPGGDITVHAADRAGQQVSIVVFSTPQSLGVHTLSAQGTTDAVLPADLAPGAHRVAVYSLTGALLAWAPITVDARQLAATDADATAAQLAATGGNPSGPLAAVLVLLLAGAGLVRVSRRPRAVPAGRR